MDKITLYNKTDGNIEFLIGENRRLSISHKESYEVAQEEFNYINKNIFKNGWLSTERDKPITCVYDPTVSFKMYGDFITSNLYNLITHVEAATGSTSKVTEIQVIDVDESYLYANIIS